jgi:hypothetical protein
MHASFDEVDVEFDAAVIEETGEPVPVQHLLADARDLWRIRPKGRRSTNMASAENDLKSNIQVSDWRAIASTW